MSSRRSAVARALGDPASASLPMPATPPGLEHADLEARLTEAEETLRAIRHGEVDALVVHDGSPHPQVFTLSSADRPYRRFVDNMRDGAATVSEAGTVLYANRSLAEMLNRPLAQLIGSPIASLVADGDNAALEEMSGRSGGTAEVELIAAAGGTVPVRINTSALDVDSHLMRCMTFADLTQQNTHKLEMSRLQADRMLELEEAQHALTQLATHDALTGLANRTLLIDRIMHALALGERSETFVGVIFVDLDGFKKINDTRGHATGDEVLRQVAVRLQAAVRTIDSVSRLGGDEFVVLLPAMAGPEDAIHVAERIAADVDRPIKLAHGSMVVTASVGISVSGPGPVGGNHRADQLIQQADTAMYHAKSRGGAKTELFEPGTTPTVREADRESWVGRIRDGLDEDRFVLYAQPVIDLATGATVQHELLLRLRDLDGQLIPPLAFLPTAERCGLIGEIDQWVIRQAARIAALGHPVAVNLSAASSGDPLVLDAIGEELLHYQTNPGNIVFEITETAVMQNMDRGRHFAERMIGLGCRFALDDFGTGFASFTYLKQLPVQYLKIDIEFVRDVVESQRDRSVVTAIVSLARGFGQQTIAEGVEDEETAAVLRTLGVTLAQGYLFGAPTPLVAGAPASIES
jgi:diguanylate cyclase (GGDEF)-like protein/PAS domain S-box-containing protein